MANWGKPDFDTKEVIDYESLWARIRAEGGITSWPYVALAGYNRETVYRYCVNTAEPIVAEWQQVRLSMKGKPTHKKLEILLAWWDRYILSSDREVRIAVTVQVTNYLGALRRGGQLNERNQVRKYI